MKRLLTLCAIAGAFTMSCKNQPTSEGTGGNPLLSEYSTPFQVPPFELIKPEHFMPAFEMGMKQQKAEIEAIMNNPEEPTFANTIEAMDKSGDLLGKVSNVFYGLASANTSEELQKIEEEISPLLSAHRDEINLNPKLFTRIKKVYENRTNSGLDSVQLFIVENLYKGFVRNGANLSPEKMEVLKRINLKMSSLGVKFEQNLLAETNSFKLIIDNPQDLAGLPENVIASAAARAKNDSLEGKWIFTTQKPSMLPFLQFSEKRELRAKLYCAYLSRCNNGNDRDNNQVLSEIMKLRAQRAQLLGYKTYSDMVMEPRMARNPENAFKLMKQLWTKALPVAQKEAKELQNLINKEGGKFQLASSDWWFYAEKLRKEKYDLDDNELRPYFKLENVRDGAFKVANQLYGITFTQLTGVPLPHPDAQVFEVKEANGSHIGILYMDFFARSSKQQGAWCGGYRDHRVVNGKEVNPVITTVFNFSKPVEGQPSLLNLEEVETVYHEFGHALDGLFAKNTYSTTFTPRDFVELPSQIMEHWATEPEVLKTYARHYQTGEAIPDKLIQKITNSGYFNQGFSNVEILVASMLDLAYHTQTDTLNLDIQKFEKNYLNSIGLIKEIEPRYHSTYFGHIIGGYDSGYYGYTWAAVLDNDAFEAFKETGIFNHETALKFRKNILERSGTMDAMEMYKNFRGREPQIEPLLKNRGLQ